VYVVTQPREVTVSQTNKLKVSLKMIGILKTWMYFEDATIHFSVRNVQPLESHCALMKVYNASVLSHKQV